VAAVTYRRRCRNVGAVVGGVLAALIFVGIFIVVVVFLRRQWARSEENKARINARMAGEDEILVSHGLYSSYRPQALLYVIIVVNNASDNHEL